jgi:hypothetical protein
MFQCWEFVDVIVMGVAVLMSCDTIQFKTSSNSKLLLKEYFKSFIDRGWKDGLALGQYSAEACEHNFC